MARIMQNMWAYNGGTITTVVNFSSNNIVNPIRDSLAIDQSQKRANKLRWIIGKKFKFNPRRRQDINVILLAASPTQARQIRPALKFYFAGNIPVYATSNIYSGIEKPQLDKDLDGIIFGDSTTKFNRVVGNRVENCEGGGIAIAASAGDTIVSENYVYRTRAHGIGITFGGANCQIVNNKIVEAGYFSQPGDFCHAIAVDSNGGALPHGYNNVISGNIIINPGFWIAWSVREFPAGCN